MSFGYFEYNEKDTSPEIGVASGNKQSISVYDSHMQGRRTIVTTPEKIDEFIKERKNAKSAAENKGWWLCGLSGAIGTAIGAGYQYLFDKKYKLSSSVAPTALVGLLFGLGLGCLIPYDKSEKADINITQKFIKENK